ncbi:MAG: VanZ family protein [Spirochaetaceae bacterium]|nr:VanZ family protein [Spirochaetaceae bacterium]
MPVPVPAPPGSHRRTAVRIALLLYALLVLAASLYPSPPHWATAAGRDHLVHFAAYLLLGVLLTAGLNAGATAWTVWRRCGTALLIGACYGAALELAQRYTGRMPETGDALANLLGVAAGAVWVTLSRLRRGFG